MLRVHAPSNSVSQPTATRPPVISMRSSRLPTRGKPLAAVVALLLVFGALALCCAFLALIGALLAGYHGPTRPGLVEVLALVADARRPAPETAGLLQADRAGRTARGCEAL